MSIKKKVLSTLAAVAIAVSAVPVAGQLETVTAATEDISNTMEWDAVKIGGGGFVSGIVTGKDVMYARTDVGGAYKYNYETMEWDQLFAFLGEEDRGYLSVDAMAIDPTDDNTAYFLVGCAYFSAERTAIFKTTDGGKTFKEIEVTDLIKVHGNGYGRQCGEAIAVDPENPDVLYCGGDTDGLIMSTDAGETWSYVDSFNELGLFTNEINWPTWTNTVEKTTVGESYVDCNGIATIAIEDGKVYVGVSDNTIGANVYVADVGSDNWEPLSADLPTSAFPSRINKDADGNLLIAYVGGLHFDRSGGGIYKYDTTTKTVTDISPTGDSFGGCVSLPDDANTLVATTCGQWSSQLWYEGAWEDENVCWGDQFYRSKDGGKTWESITPGNAKGWGQPLQADYLQDSGYEWIRNKAIHWCGAIVLDPKDSDRILITSGNGVFACDNVWDELPVFYFHPDGIEEVVCLDMVSVPGGNAISVIGDYDGFVHEDVNEIPAQHQPNMGSTCAIAYCPQNPDVMIRIANGNNDVAPGYYTLDGGKTWTKMANSPGGRAAITQLDESTYRFFKSAGDSDQSASVSYSDDFGQTWNTCSGIPSSYGSKPTNMYVDPEDPSLVYAYVTYYNSSWSYSKTEPAFSDAHYTLCVSTDYGKSFTSKDICMYDQCDSAGRIAALGDGSIILAGGWYGMYKATDKGSNIEELDVFYCKTVGYGAPEKEGDLNTLYMYGKPTEADPEGVYRSQDGGVSWVLINKDKLYGGTGNGNFLIGDMNEFGKVYMSTVGCGIIYGQISDGTVEPTDPTEPTTEETKPTDPTEPSTTEPSTTEPSTTEPAEPTTEPSTTEPTEPTTEPPTVVTTEGPTGEPQTVPDGTASMYGDVNIDGKINVADLVMLNLFLLNPETNPIGEQNLINANCSYDKVLDTNDSMLLINCVVMIISETDLGPQE